MVTFSLFVLWVVSFETGCADGEVVGVLWCALSRDVTLVMPVVCTSKEGTLQGGEVLTWRVVVVTLALWRDKGVTITSINTYICGTGTKPTVEK